MSPKKVPQGGKTNSGCQIEEPKGKHALSVLSLWTDNIINELFMVQQLSCWSKTKGKQSHQGPAIPLMIYNAELKECFKII